MQKKLFNLLILTILLIPVLGLAATFPLPTKHDKLVGTIQGARVGFTDNNFHTLGREFDIGYNQMVNANPKMDPKLPGLLRRATIPSKYILPPGPHTGIVINLPEMRLYYYPKHSHEVMTFPIGIGIVGWATPLGKTKIIQKQRNPSWYVPKSINKYLAAKGINLPKVVPPGPKNPLGNYAMRLAMPGYLIHGTNMPTTIGTRASSGCIRLFPEDIKSLFSVVPRKTPVRIIDDPYKVGWNHGKLYLEAHQPVTDDGTAAKADLTPLTNKVLLAIKKKNVKIDWQKVIQVALQHNGIPQIISIAKETIMKKVAKHIPVPNILK